MSIWIRRSRARPASGPQGLWDDGVGEQAIPVLGCPVRGDDQAGAVGAALGDEFVEVVGLLRGELAQREVVEDEPMRERFLSLF